MVTGVGPQSFLAYIWTLIIYSPGTIPRMMTRSSFILDLIISIIKTKTNKQINPAKLFIIRSKKETVELFLFLVITSSLSFFRIYFIAKILQLNKKQGAAGKPDAGSDKRRCQILNK